MPDGSANAESSEAAEIGEIGSAADAPPPPPEVGPADASEVSPADTGVLEIVRSLDEDDDIAGEAGEPAAVPDPAPEEAPTVPEGSAEPEGAPPVEFSDDVTPGPEQAVAEAAETPPEGEQAPAAEEPVAESVAEAVSEPNLEPAPEPSARIPWWPFALYSAAWLVGLGTALYLLLQVPTDRALIEAAIYGYTVLGGLVLTALGPLMILVTWFVLWLKRGKGNRKGLFSKVVLYGSLCTLGGVLLWWGMLMLLDQMRLGQLA